MHEQAGTLNGKIMNNYYMTNFQNCRVFLVWHDFQQHVKEY